MSGIPNGGRDKVYLRMELPLTVMEQYEAFAVLTKVRSHDQVRCRGMGWEEAWDNRVSAFVI